MKNEKRPKTIFCDIDGTLVEHSDPCQTAFPKHTLKLIDGTHKKLLEWDRRGYNIVLTTGRREGSRKETEKQLSQAGIIYDKLIMGIGGGPRVLINDCKPDGTKTAHAITVNRDEGLSSVTVEDLRAKSTEYFIAFSEKQVNKLSSMFADEVELKDWNNHAVGKEDVLSINESIFNSCDLLAVDVKSMYVCDMTVIAEIIVNVDSEKIPVTDIIHFNGQEQITSITAYRGN